MDLLAARYRRRDTAALARAERLRAHANEFAAFLYARGATRVVLFGSLARGSSPHAATDIDLAVEGLSAKDVLECAIALEDKLGDDLAWVGDRPRGVDLIRLEDAAAGLRAEIAADGRECPRVTG